MHTFLTKSLVVLVVATVLLLGLDLSRPGSTSFLPTVLPTGVPAIAHGLLTDAFVTGRLVRLHGDHIPILTWAFIESIETTRPR